MTDAQEFSYGLSEIPHNKLTNEMISELDRSPQFFWYLTSKDDPLVKPIILSSTAKLLQKYNGLWSSHDHDSIYLTFELNEDTEPNLTQILDLADTRGIKLNFFITNYFLKNYPEQVKKVSEDGHLVGAILSRFSQNTRIINESSIENYQTLIQQITSDYESLTKRPLDPYIRPAFGVFTEQSLAIHQKMGYYTVFWSLSHMAWSPPNEPSPQKSLKILGEQLSNGAIIQLNPNSTTNIEILDDFIKYGQRAGYHFDRLDS
ncbi:polysaccharide deacetylase family protein [Globicatella sulfidifaciens]